MLATLRLLVGGTDAVVYFLFPLLEDFRIDRIAQLFEDLVCGSEESCDIAGPYIRRYREATKPLGGSHANERAVARKEGFHMQIQVAGQLRRCSLELELGPLSRLRSSQHICGYMPA